MCDPRYSVWEVGSYWRLWSFEPWYRVWDLFGRNDAKAETLVLWHLMRRVDSLEKTDAGRDWGQEEKGTTEDEMAGCHH